MHCTGYHIVCVLLLGVFTNLKADLCPDKHSVCPTGSTCCKLPTGQYGCCPLPNAVCCTDGVHCCPNGYTCDVEAGTCNKQEPTTTNAAKFQDSISPQNSVICPGGTYQCPNGNTCCPSVYHGQWNCCPMVAAVCCNDYVHCCPYGTYCSGGLCYRRGQLSVPWSKKSEAQIIDAPQINAHKLVYASTLDENQIAPEDEDQDHGLCPGSAKSCPDDNTCCLLRDGNYGCCKYPNAVCCRDGKHCCPSGTGCIKGQCIGKSGESYLPWDLKQTNLYVCPDKISKCSGDMPCCKRNNGQWGCCPFEGGICCEDGEYCCPGGYKCDVASHQCTKDNSKVAKKAITWT